MGRYATFSTGVDYKFAFAIQSSADIQKFGGIDTSTVESCETNYYRGVLNFSTQGIAVQDKSPHTHSSPLGEAEREMRVRNLGTERYNHEWDAKRHLPDVEHYLHILEVAFHFQRPALETYEKSCDGTHSLLHDAHDLVVRENVRAMSVDPAIIYRYILGVIIYHQLMYTDTLSVRYEG